MQLECNTDPVKLMEFIFLDTKDGIWGTVYCCNNNLQTGSVFALPLLKIELDNFFKCYSLVMVKAFLIRIES